MKYYLNFVNVYEEPTPREMMIQNIQQMIYCKFESHEEITLKLLEERLLSANGIEGNDAATAAAQDWVAFQKENGVEDDTVIMECDGSTNCVQFDLRPEKT